MLSYKSGELSSVCGCYAAGEKGGGQGLEGSRTVTFRVTGNTHSSWQAEVITAITGTAIMKLSVMSYCTTHEARSRQNDVHLNL